MNCETVQHQLGAFLDNELDAERNKKIRMHLFKCTACEEKANELKSACEFMDDGVSLRMDPFFTTRLNAAIDKRNASPQHLPRKVLIPAGVVAAAMLILLTIGIHSYLAPPTTDDYYINYNILTLAPEGSFTDGYTRDQNIDINRKADNE